MLQALKRVFASNWVYRCKICFCVPEVFYHVSSSVAVLPHGVDAELSKEVRQPIPDTNDQNVALNSILLKPGTASEAAPSEFYGRKEHHGDKM